MAPKSNKEEFVRRAREKHEKEDGTPLYNYDKFNYITSQTKGIITCFDHGDFIQIPNKHINTGRGCPKCAIIKNSNKQRKTLSQFISEAKEVHGEMYDYSKFEYINIDTNSVIICKEHGEFKQCPWNHLQGNGCPVCSYIYRSNNSRKPLEEFIIHSKKIHNDIYNYDKFKYKNNKTPSIITCFKHGEFLQCAKSHLSGSGCPSCVDKNYSKVSIKIFDIVIDKLKLDLQHAKNKGEKLIKTKRKKYRADGYIKAQKETDINEIFSYFKGCFKFRNISSLELIIEYHGCFWHGCEDCFPIREEVNKKNSYTYETLYNKTIQKRLNLIKAGYNYIEIWEHQTKDFY